MRGARRWFTLSCCWLVAGCFNPQATEGAAGAITCQSDDDCIIGGCALGRCFGDLDVPLVVRPPSDTARRGIEDTTLVLALAFDGAPADHVELVIDEAPPAGTAIVVGHELHYTPGPDEHGAFEVTVSARDRRTIVDGVAGRQSAGTTITLEITEIDDLPVLQSVPLSIDEDTEGFVNATCADVDSGECVISVERQPALGIVERLGDALVFVPDEDVFDGTETYSFDRMGDLAPLNSSSVGLDGTEATLLGAGLTRLDDVMVMAPAQDGVLARVFEATLVGHKNQRPRLRNVFQGDYLSVPAWKSRAFIDSFPSPQRSVLSLCPGGERVETTIIDAGLNLSHHAGLDTRLGAHVGFSCGGTPLPPSTAEVRGLGVEGGSGQGPGVRFILGRDRDFTSLGGSADCSDHRQRFGDAFLPGVYVVGGISTSCGTIEDDLPRRCGDGAIDVINGIAEGCDDGNAVDADGCSSACALERQ